MNQRAVFPCLLLGALALATGCASSNSAAANKLYEEGLDQLEAGRTEDARETFQRGVKAHPRHHRMRFALARLQFEAGEALHLRERQALRDAAVAFGRGKRKEGIRLQREGVKQRDQALPYFKLARAHLDEVLQDEHEASRQAWVYYLRARIAVFFQDWERAVHDLDRAIEKGQPTGALLAQWREFQAGLREKLELRQ